MHWFVLCCLAIAARSHGAPAESGKTLHVASWPAHAEVFVGTLPEPGSHPAPLTPHPLMIPADSGYVRLHLFRPGYADTALDVRVPPGPNSYLLVHLRPENDPAALEGQKSFLAVRNRHRWGHRLMWSSLLPAALSAGFAAAAEWQYRAADTEARRMDASTLLTGAAYADAQKAYSSALHSGDSHLRRARWTLAAGAILLTTGFVLTF